MTAVVGLICNGKLVTDWIRYLIRVRCHRHYFTWDSKWYRVLYAVLQSSLDVGLIQHHVVQMCPSKHSSDS